MKDFLFVDYCPKVFSKIRQAFGVDTIDYVVRTMNTFIIYCNNFYLGFVDKGRFFVSYWKSW